MREIFYRAGAHLVAARLNFAPEPAVVDRKNLFDVSAYDAAGPHSNYDVSPDRSWFVFARRGSTNHRRAAERARAGTPDRAWAPAASPDA